MSGATPWRDVEDPDVDREADARAALARRRLGVPGIVGLLLTILGVLLTIEATQVLNRTLGKADDDRLADLTYTATREVADAVAAPLAREDTSALRGLAVRLARGVGIAYLLVIDPEGNVLAHSFDGALPTELVGSNDAPGGQGAQRTNLIIPDPVLRSGRPVLDVAMPVMAGQLGVVRVGMDKGTGHAHRRRALAQLLGIMGGTSLLLIGLGWFITRRFVSAPTPFEAPYQQPDGTSVDIPEFEHFDTGGPAAPDATTAGGSRPEAPTLEVRSAETVEASYAEPPAAVDDNALAADDSESDAPVPANDAAARDQLAQIVALATRVEQGHDLASERADDDIPALAAVTRALKVVAAKATTDCQEAIEAQVAARERDQAASDVGVQEQLETESAERAQERADMQARLTGLEHHIAHAARAARTLARGRLDRFLAAEPAAETEATPDVATLERAHEALARHLIRAVQEVRQYATDVHDGAERLAGIHSALEHDLGVQATDTDLVAAKLANVALGLSGVAKDHDAASEEGQDIVERAQASREAAAQVTAAMVRHRRAMAGLAPRLNSLVHGTTLLAGHAEALSNTAAQTHLLALDAAVALGNPDPTTDLTAVADRLRALVADGNVAADALAVQADQLMREAADSARSCEAQNTELAAEHETVNGMSDDLQTLAGMATSLAKRVAHAAEATNDMPDLNAMTLDVQTVRKAVARLQEAATEGTRVVEALRQVADSVQQSVAGFTVEG